MLQLKRQGDNFLRSSFFLGTLSLLFAFSSLAWATDKDDAQQQLQKAFELNTRGLWGEAAGALSKAADLFEQSGNRNNHATTLLRLAQTLDNLGRPYQALQKLQQAQKLLPFTKNPELAVRVHNSLGNVWLKITEPEKAKIHLQQAWDLAGPLNNEKLLASLHNDFGNVYLATQEHKKGTAAFSESFAIAQKHHLHSLTFTSGVNLARLHIQQGRTQEARETLDSMTGDLSQAPDNYLKAFTYLNLGLLYLKLHDNSVRDLWSAASQLKAISQGTAGGRGVIQRPSQQRDDYKFPPDIVTPGEALPPPRKDVSKEREPEPSYSQKAYEAFLASRNLARTLQDTRTESFALGFLGHLYELEKRPQEGLQLTYQAINLAQSSLTFSPLYQWHWQVARLQTTLGYHEKALNAYEIAKAALHPLQPALFASRLNTQRPFRVRQGSLYFEYADLLLQKAHKTFKESEKKEILKSVRNIIEDFKSAELQDYFQDACVETALERSSSVTIDSISPTTAVLYPIILPDRLEILVSIAGEIRPISHPIFAKEVNKAIQKFRNALQSGKGMQFLPSAQKLYQWFIEPLLEDLATNSVNTLVIVPDGQLRTIPFAALHDGNQFLIQQFALAYTPGLTLTAISSIDRTNWKILEAGLSEAVDEFVPLQNVKHEMKKIQTYFQGPVLMDSEFNTSRLKEELGKGIYNIIHLATHARMMKNPQDTFIQATDSKIRMNQFSEMIGVLKYGSQVPELITLSACETALGDDQAALGLAGVAIKAGAKSALASLWAIDDEATAEFIPEFYRHLKFDTQGNKATALQQAQLKMIESARFSHPKYWSPFLLIGNWL